MFLCYRKFNTFFQFLNMYVFPIQETVALYSIGSEDMMIENDNYASVRTLAKQYIKLIKSVQRTGPYYLGMFKVVTVLTSSTRFKRNVLDIN